MKRNDLNIEELRNNLLKELSLLEAELLLVGRKNPDNPIDWEAKPADMGEDSADENEVADKMEEYEENTAVLSDLEIRFNDIKDALKKIDNGNYGFCEVCKNEIEIDRLEANPASRTCKIHME